MKTSKRTLLVSLFIITGGAFLSNAVSETIAIDFHDTLQCFDGWGTSLCWWAERIGGWPEEKLNSITALITDPDTGLGLNIFRYNIGGGDHPSHSHMRKGGAIPGYKSGENEAFNWNADPNQRAVLNSLLNHCPDAILEAFSNSPPWWMTKSGCTSGNTDGSNNLKDDYYDDFANYLVAVVQHFHEEWGITFSTLEPLNESEANWWKANGSQEGCHFDRSSQEKIIQEVYASLTKAGLEKNIMITADDANSIDACLANLTNWSSKTISCLGRINSHSYSGTKRLPLRFRANELNLPLYQSESGPLNWSGNTVYDAALFMSKRIIMDLYEMRAQAWLDWQLLDDSNNWQLITTDWRGAFSPGTNFFARSAFTRFIRPGWSIVATNSSDVAAAVAPDSTNFGIVILNDENKSKQYTLSLSHIDTTIKAAEVHRTTKSDPCLLVTTVGIEENTIAITVPARSIISIRPRLPERTPLTGTALIGGIPWIEAPFSLKKEKMQGQLVLTYPESSNFTCTLYRINGTALFLEQLPSNGSYFIDFSRFTAGTYLLTVSSGSNGREHFVKRFFW